MLRIVKGRVYVLRGLFPDGSKIEIVLLGGRE